MKTWTKTTLYKHLTKTNSESGLVAMTSLLIISAVALSIAVSASLLAVADNQNSLSYKKGVETLKIAESCIEEGMIRLRDDASYSGGNLQVGDGNCTILVTGNGANRTIESTATIDGPPDFVRAIRVTVKRTGNSISLLTWEEI